MAKINLRSPYFITVTNTNLTQVDMELYVYTGTQTTHRGTVKYTIESLAYNESVTFEISELCRDYITYEAEVLWVDYRIKKYISGVAGSYGSFVQLTAFDGYGYFDEGANPQNDKLALISNNTMLVLQDATITIPVDSSVATSVVYKSGGVTIETDTITSSSVSTTQVIYSNTIENDIDTVEVTDGVDTETITIRQVEECLHTPYILKFVNKFGVLQDIYFFKKSSLTMTTKEEKYKSNILVDGSYSTNNHQSKILTKQGNERLTLNSGFYPEDNNEVFRQLLLSETVWIGEDELPCNIVNSSFQFKTQLNDKLINYTLEIEYAFDKINNIR